MNAVVLAVCKEKQTQSWAPMLVIHVLYNAKVDETINVPAFYLHCGSRWRKFKSLLFQYPMVHLIYKQ